MTEYIITEVQLEIFERIAGNLSNLASKVRSRPYQSERDKVHTEQCWNCTRKGLRECMYHGYPEDTIPFACSYKIGNMAVHTVYDVPTGLRQVK